MRERLVGYIQGINQFTSDAKAWIQLEHFDLPSDEDLHKTVTDKLLLERWSASELPTLQQMGLREFKHAVDTVFKSAIKPPTGQYALVEKFYEYYAIEYGKLEFSGAMIKGASGIEFVYVTQIPKERVLYILRYGVGE